MIKNLISLNDLNKDELISLLDFAENFIDADGKFKKDNLFPDKTIANMFFEPSTRTKCSFDIA